MKITNLRIKNFRNIRKIEYQASPGLNILYGENAQGKTNILEALFYLSTGNSFRSNQEKVLLNYDSSNLQVQARYIRQERIIDSSISYGPDAKLFTINNKKAGYKHSDRIRVSLFTPDDLYLVKGSPAKRRFFLDFLLGQISQEYLFKVEDYRKILKRRNLILKKEETNSKSFAIINDVFIDLAAQLLIFRLNLINAVDEVLQEIYPRINDDGSRLKIRYALSFPVDSGKINLDVLKDSLKKQMQTEGEKEKRRRSTLMGPHLDDMHIYLNEQSARLFASQGQQRNIAVCLKLAETITFKKIKGFFPVFLMDEVLAELDEGRSNRLLKYLEQSPFQSFLSSVNLGGFAMLNAAISLVKEGCLLRKE